MSVFGFCVIFPSSHDIFHFTFLFSISDAHKTYKKTKKIDFFWIFKLNTTEVQPRTIHKKKSDFPAESLQIKITEELSENQTGKLIDLMRKADSSSSMKTMEKREFHLRRERRTIHSIHLSRYKIFLHFQVFNLEKNVN